MTEPPIYYLSQFFSFMYGAIGGGGGGSRDSWFYVN
jgi:hypothetical protein